MLPSVCFSSLVWRTLQAVITPFNHCSWSELVGPEFEGIGSGSFQNWSPTTADSILLVEKQSLLALWKFTNSCFSLSFFTTSVTAGSLPWNIHRWTAWSCSPHLVFHVPTKVQLSSWICNNTSWQILLYVSRHSCVTLWNHNLCRLFVSFFS